MMEAVSKQTTLVRAVKTKLEWRIDHFAKLMRLYKNGNNLVSRQFGSPLIDSVSWELHVYPNGKRDTDKDYVSFFLRQVGLRDGEEPVMTDFRIFAKNPGPAGGDPISVCKDVKDFTHQQGRGKFQVGPEKLQQALFADGSLHLICEVEFFPPGTKLMAEAEERSSSERMEVNLQELLDTELFSDCCIKVGSKLLKSHRCILGLHSQVFRSMFQQEGMVEAQEGIIDITDAHPDPVHAMLEFMYTGKTGGVERCPEELLALSEKYAVLKLKELCENQLAKSLSVRNITDVIVYADTYNAQILKNACVQFMSINHKAILKTADWKRLRKEHPDLANELLELILSGEGGSYGTLHAASFHESSPSPGPSMKMENSVGGRPPRKRARRGR